MTACGTHRLSPDAVWDTGLVHMLTGHGWAGWSNWSVGAAVGGLNASTAAAVGRRMLDRRAFAAAHYDSRFERFANGSGVGAVQRRTWPGHAQPTAAAGASALRTHPRCLPWP